MREYEMICIFKPDSSEEIVEQVFGKLKKAFDANNGILLNREGWGKKKLAYDIDRNSKGIFFQLSYLGEGALNDAMMRVLRYEDSVLRYMPIRLADKVDVEAKLASLNKAEASNEAS